MNKQTENIHHVLPSTVFTAYEQGVTTNVHNMRICEPGNSMLCANSWSVLPSLSSRLNTINKSNRKPNLTPKTTQTHKLKTQIMKIVVYKINKFLSHILNSTYIE